MQCARLLQLVVWWAFVPSTLQGSGAHGAVDIPVLTGESISAAGSVVFWARRQNVRFPVALRGGGKGGCKAKHLSRVKEGRRIMMGRHAFPNLNLGASHEREVSAKTLTTVTEATARERKSMTDHDSDDSVSSWEVQEVNRRMEKRVRTMKEILPENGLIPLTGLGRRELGALELMHSYKGRPIKILRKPRPPEFGDLWAWGSNYDGQLGIADGCKIDRLSPTLLPFLPDGVIESVVAGSEHTLLLRSDGRVFGCGLNACGQLGHGNTSEARREFVPAVAIRGRVEAVAAGALHSLAVLRSGDVVAWGSNSSGQIGPSLSSVWGKIDADPRGLLASMGFKNLTDDEVRSMAGPLIEALQEEQDMIVQGLVPPKPTRVFDTEVSKKKRRKWWFKLAASSAIAQPAVVDGVGCRGAPVVLAAGSTFSLARGPDGLVRQWGTLPWETEAGGHGYHPNPIVVENLPSTVVGLWAGERHCLALLEGGELLAWGSNAAGQLGHAALGPCSSAAVVLSGVASAAAGGNVSLAVKHNGEVYQWGQINGFRPARDPVLVQGLPCIAAAVATGGGTCFALMQDGSLFAWGHNERGQCGRGLRKPPPMFRSPVRVRGLYGNAMCLAVGKRHTLALTREGATLQAPASAAQAALPSVFRMSDMADDVSGQVQPKTLLPVS